jgi:hypothetical protein
MDGILTAGRNHDDHIQQRFAAMKKSRKKQDYRSHDGTHPGKMPMRIVAKDAIQEMIYRLIDFFLA